MVAFVNKMNVGTLSRPFILVIQNDLQKKKGAESLGHYFTAMHGFMKHLFRGSFLWNTLDDSIKQDPTLASFKSKIKS